MTEKKAVEAKNSAWGLIVDGERGVWRAYDTRAFAGEGAFFHDSSRMDNWGRKILGVTVRGTSLETLKTQAFAEAGVEPDEMAELKPSTPPVEGESIAVRNHDSGLVFDGKTGELSRFGAKDAAYYAALRSIEARDGTPVQAWECEHESAAVMLMLRTHGPALGPVIKPDTRRA